MASADRSRINRRLRPVSFYLVLDDNSAGLSGTNADIKNAIEQIPLQCFAHGISFAEQTC